MLMVDGKLFIVNIKLPNISIMIIRQVEKTALSVPLYIILVVPFVLQICLAVGLVSWLSLRQGQQTVNQLATQLQQSVGENLLSDIQTYLSTPHQINQINALGDRSAHIGYQKSRHPRTLLLLLSYKIFPQLVTFTSVTPREDILGRDAKMTSASRSTSALSECGEESSLTIAATEKFALW